MIPDSDYDGWEQILRNYTVQFGSIHDFYEVREKLGRGTFGSVYLAIERQDPRKSMSYASFNVGEESKRLDSPAGIERKNSKVSGNKVAIKILQKKKIAASSSGVEYLLNEVRVHWALEQCEGVLGLISLIEDNEIVCIVLEYQSKGSLMNTILKSVKLQESEVVIIMEQILLALDFF